VESVYIQYNEGVEPDKSLCRYCGDAAGRKSDHSAADRYFAENLGVSFSTPEEFFRDQKPQPFLPSKFDPENVIRKTSSTANDHIKFPHPIEMIIMVGCPASGKSSYVRSELLPKGYIHVSRDILKSGPKCKSFADEQLGLGNKVVIDNTNPTVQDRQEYIRIAKKHGVIVRCFVMNVDRIHASHNNKFRELVGDKHDTVPDVAFNAYHLRFQEPADTEGFTDIVKVNFIPRFSSEDRKQTYTMHLLEK